jgi:tRNA-uridine 2-sulfurtransferase
MVEKLRSAHATDGRPDWLLNAEEDPCMRIAVAMSGGVDSSVAAALLAEQGHDVIGLSMQLYDQSEVERLEGTPPGTLMSVVRDGSAPAAPSTTCTTPGASPRLGIPHYISIFERQFRDTRWSPTSWTSTSPAARRFRARCNSDLKFVTLLDRRRRTRADRLATGHYARASQDADGQGASPARGADPEKDQSYFLFSLTQAQLARAIGSPSGRWTRPRCAPRATRQSPWPTSPTARKSASCRTATTRRSSRAKRPGRRRRGGSSTGRASALDRTTGSTASRGPAQGPGLSSGVPLYVVRIDAGGRRVTVGPRTALEQTRLTASGVNWIAENAPATWIPVHAQIRHRHRPAAARVRALDAGRAELVFDAPQAAVTPGQAVVFYDGDVVVGGGWID